MIRLQSPRIRKKRVRVSGCCCAPTVLQMIKWCRLKERAKEMGKPSREIGTGDYIKWLVKEKKAKVIRPAEEGKDGQVGEYRISALAWGQLGI